MPAINRPLLQRVAGMVKLLQTEMIICVTSIIKLLHNEYHKPLCTRVYQPLRSTVG